MVIFFVWCYIGLDKVFGVVVVVVVDGDREDVVLVCFGGEVVVCVYGGWEYGCYVGFFDGFFVFCVFFDVDD